MYTPNFVLSLVTAAVVPAILSGTVVRLLKGRTRRLAAAAVLIGLTAIPCVGLWPKVVAANKSGSPDAGAYIILGILMLMLIVFVSGLIGFAAGAFLLSLRRRKQSRIETVF